MNNKSYFFDTYAIIELIKGNPNYEFVKDHPIITSVMNLAEVYYALLLAHGKEITDSILENLNIEFLEITPKISIESAFFRYKNKKSNLSYIDCVGYITALRNNLLFLTGNKEFKNFDNVEFVDKFEG